MENNVRFKLGNLIPGDIVQVNLAYMLITKPCNIYTQSSIMRYFYPNSGSDNFPTFLIIKELAVRISIDGDTIHHLGLEGEADIKIVEGPFNRADHPLDKQFDDPMHSYMIDAFSPPKPALEHLFEHYPIAADIFTTQVFGFAASCLDSASDRQMVIDFFSASELTGDMIFDFSAEIEKFYSIRRTNRNIEIDGFAILGRGASDDTPAVFYTLGLYNSEVGRDLLFVTENPEMQHIEMFKIAAKALRERKSIDEVNELINDHGCRIMIRNLKTFPKYAFEYQSEQCPVKGVLSFVAK